MPRMAPGVTSRIPHLIAFLIVAFALLIRVHALTVTYGRVGAPGWIAAVQDLSRATVGRMLPKGVSWHAAPLYQHRDAPPTHYFSDPYTYLQFGRQMRSFYAAHYREPMVPFATKVSLRVLQDQDVAVSFASLFFSVLAVVATYLLGSAAFSRPVGLIAALALAIEFDVISDAITGGRDSAFTFAAVLAAYSTVRYVRRPSMANAILMGACASLAGLVRLTSISFVAPLLVYALFKTPGVWKIRWQRVGAAVLALIVLVGPYMYNCWRSYRDPFYAINWHTENTLQLEASEAGTQPSAMTYAKARFASRPFQMLDTVTQGLTTYPFLNKWSGFDRWVAGLGTVLRWAALFGLIWAIGAPNGRLLLMVLVTSLLPFAFTWKLASDWRFTEHAYPFLLIAAGAALVQVVTWLSPSAWRTMFKRDALQWRTATFWAAVFASIAISVWIVTRPLPALIMREAVAEHEDGMIQAGERDGAFFDSGWSAPMPVGTIVMRVSAGPTSTVSLPLPRVDDYTAIVRVNPYPEPHGDPAAAADLPLLHVGLNGQVLGDLQVRWTPGRVGSYNIHLTRRLVRKDSNQLTFRAEQNGPANGRAPQFSLWYVRLHTADDAASWRQAIEITPTPHTGYLDTASCSMLEGWVIDLGRRDAPADVDVLDGGTYLMTMTAAEFRPDLLTAGLGNGRHAYRIPVPASIRDGRSHVVSVRVAGTTQNLTGSPATLTCRTP